MEIIFSREYDCQQNTRVFKNRNNLAQFSSYVLYTRNSHLLETRRNIKVENVLDKQSYL